MNNIKEIEDAIAELPRDQLTEFRVWFAAFDAQLFDAAIERNVEAGKLDRLAEEALPSMQRAASVIYETLREFEILGCL